MIDTNERRQFAARILAGMGNENPTQQISIETLVNHAVARADALIERLNRDTPPPSGGHVELGDRMGWGL